MKTNHRRKNRGLKIPPGVWYTGKDEDGRPKYGMLTSMALMRGGCSPSFSGRDGARRAIAGKKKKDHRSARHRADDAVRQEIISLE